MLWNWLSASYPPLNVANSTIVNDTIYLYSDGIILALNTNTSEPNIVNASRLEAEWLELSLRDA